jgi:peptidoglycan/xylan/chitin deacetylase (PgdA/CDA1 family)
MQTHARLRSILLLLLAFILGACTSVSAEPVTSPTPTNTLLPTTTATPLPTKTLFVATRTRIPSPTLAPAQTETPLPTPTSIPTIAEPTIIMPPVPALPPAPDGVVRSADVPILMYHYISASPSAQDRIRYGLSVSPEMFEAQLQLLVNNGYTTISLRDLYESLAVGQSLPAKPIILTFDDGYLDNYTNAFPILQKYGMTGTFFVLTGPADDGEAAYLTWDMITELSNAGMDIQLHSRDHLDMRNRSFDWLVFQIIGGRQSIEGHTGKPVIFMAYPSGKYDENVLRFLRGNNFWAAVTTASGMTHTLSEPLLWDRVRISGQMDIRAFARMLGLDLAASQTRSTDTPTSVPPTPTPQPPRAIRPSATPHSSTQTPPPTKTPTPAQSPLLTPTVGQSPLATPRP